MKMKWSEMKKNPPSKGGSRFCWNYRKTWLRETLKHITPFGSSKIQYICRRKRIVSIPPGEGNVSCKYKYRTLSGLLIICEKNRSDVILLLRCFKISLFIIPFTISDFWFPMYVPKLGDKPKQTNQKRPVSESSSRLNVFSNN